MYCSVKSVNVFYMVVVLLIMIAYDDLLLLVYVFFRRVNQECLSFGQV